MQKQRENYTRTFPPCRCCRLATKGSVCSIPRSDHQLSTRKERLRVIGTAQACLYVRYDFVIKSKLLTETYWYIVQYIGAIIILGYDRL